MSAREQAQEAKDGETPAEPGSGGMPAMPKMEMPAMPSWLGGWVNASCRLHVLACQMELASPHG